jgi:hypothetical protein
MAQWLNYVLFMQATKGVARRFSLAPGIYEESSDGEDPKCCGLNPNQFLITYLFWAFRSSFMAVLLSAAVWFFSLTILFAIFIFLLGVYKPSCIHVNGEDFASFGAARFMDAYALSWTTFSTVVRFYEVVAAFLLYVETNILKFVYSMV